MENVKNKNKCDEDEDEDKSKVDLATEDSKYDETKRGQKRWRKRSNITDWF